MKKKEFWKWFEKNNAPYLFLPDVEDKERERLINKFSKKLNAYCEHLFFEIGGHPHEDLELIISAGGNPEYFEKVTEFVAAAPNIKNWKIIALKQPQKIDFITDYSGIEFDPNEMWFLPLESNDNPFSIGICIGVPEFDMELEKQIFEGCYIVLDTFLGEKSCALDIDYVEITQLPYNPEEEGFIHFTELPNYIKWVKSKKAKKKK